MVIYTNTIDGSKLAEMELSRRAPFGAFGVMKFPYVSDTDWYNGSNASNEVSTHLFLNMNPTAPVIHKESNLTWSEANKKFDEEISRYSFNWTSGGQFSKNKNDKLD